MRRHVHDMVLVSDDALRDAILLLLRLTHNLAEGAGAASTAAAFQMREQLAGKTVVGVLSGGNLDLRELEQDHAVRFLILILILILISFGRFRTAMGHNQIKIRIRIRSR